MSKPTYTLHVPFGDTVDLAYDEQRRDIVFHRDHAGGLHFNIAQTHRHHSPSGFEWGYAGSGPADFALNILARFTDEIEPLAPERYIALWDETRVHPLVWAAHQDFKHEIIAGQPRAGATIPGSLIRNWIAAWARANETALSLYFL